MFMIEKTLLFIRMEQIVYKPLE